MGPAPGELLKIYKDLRWKAVASAILAFAVVPNLLMALLVEGLAAPRAAINIDFLAFGVLAPFLPAALAAAGVTLLLLFELVVDVAPIFHFDPVSFFLASGNLEHLSFDFALLPMGFWIFFPFAAAAAALLAWHASRNRWRWSSLVLLVLLLGAEAADAANGTSGFFAQILHVNRSLVQRNIAFSPLGRTIASIAALRGQSASGVWTPADSALARGLTFAPPTGSKLQNNIALVIVESWGHMPGALNVEDYIVSPLLTPSLRAEYEIRRGTVPFFGSTTSAEMRELCGVRGDYRDIGAGRVPLCLPAKLTQAGYHTIGIHGFWSTMFGRYSWWRRIGISKAIFLGDRQWQPSPQRCGTALRGACDGAAVNMLGAELKHGPGIFGYLLTLNSHLPVSRISAAGTAIPCVQGAVRLTASQCAIAASWKVVMTAVAALASRKDLPPTEFILVGDHSPPFFYQKDSALFDGRAVPYIILTPFKKEHM